MAHFKFFSPEAVIRKDFTIDKATVILANAYEKI